MELQQNSVQWGLIGSEQALLKQALLPLFQIVATLAYQILFGKVHLLSAKRLLEPKSLMRTTIFFNGSQHPYKKEVYFKFIL